jgi:hypothetical protein
MKVGIRQRITPGTIAPHHAIAAVRNDHTGEKGIFFFHREVEATSVIGAYNGFKECIPCRNGLMDISSHPKRDTPGRRDNFQRNEGTDIADYLFPFLFQFLGPEPVILIILLYRGKNVALFVIHRPSPFSQIPPYPPLLKEGTYSPPFGIFSLPRAGKGRYGGI